MTASRQGIKNDRRIQANGIVRPDDAGTAYGLDAQVDGAARIVPRCAPGIGTTNSRIMPSVGDIGRVRIDASPYATVEPGVALEHSRPPKNRPPRRIRSDREVT